MHDDQAAPEDSLQLFPPELGHSASRQAPLEEDALAQFLSEDVLPAEPPPQSAVSGPPRREWPVWFKQAGPAWCVGVAVVLCTLAVTAGVWSTRAADPGIDSLREAGLARHGGTAPSDRSSLADLPVRSNPNARVDAPSTRRERRDLESTRSAAAAVPAEAGLLERQILPSALALTSPTSSVAESQPLAGGDSAESRPADPIPTTVGPVASLSVEVPPLPMMTEMRAPLSPADATGIAETAAVRRTLEAYRVAYEELDVRAAANVWPTVDRRALTRAFSTLESQAVTLGECEIHVAQATATARCQGKVRFVRTFGGRDPVNASTGWLFRMRKSGESWTIEDVTGSEESRH